MLTREEVIWGYRYVLGRNPDEQAITVHTAHADVAAFRRILLDSYEFRTLGIGPYAKTCWVYVAGPCGDDAICVDLADRVIGYNIAHGILDPLLTCVFKALVKNGDTVVDVGANVGWYTLLAARMVGSSGRVVSFEPNPVIASRLLLSVQKNGYDGRVDVHEQALANKSGVSVLARPRSVANYGNAYLLDDANTLLYERHDVKLATLDDFGFERVNLIKLDVEGAEALIFEGGVETIKKYRPLIISEIFDAQLQLVSAATSANYYNSCIGLGYIAFLIEDGQPISRLEKCPDPIELDHTNVVFVPVERESEIATILKSVRPLF